MEEGKTKTLLLVEDEPLVALAEKATLENAGYRVITAGSGEEALEINQNGTAIDLILMDINLGAGMDGTQAAEIIMKERDIPLVFLSSHTEPETVAKTERITSYGYIVKNSGDTVLLASIRMAFRLFEARRVMSDTFTYSINGLCVHRLLFDDSGAPYDCEYLRVNEAFERHSGLAASSVIGRTIRDIYPDDEAEPVIQLYIDILNGRKAARQQIYFPPSRAWFELSVFATREDEFTVIVHNITVSKEAEERHQELVGHLPGIVYTFSSKRGGLYWSNQVKAILGYDPAEIKANPFLWNHSIHPDDRPAVQKAIEDHSRGADYSVEYRIRTADKRWIWLHDRFINKSVYDGEAIIDGFAIEITDHKQAEDALFEGRELYRSLFEQTSSGIYLHDPGGNIIDANQAACDQSGYSRDELLQLTIFDLYPKQAGRTSPPEEEALSIWSQATPGERLSFDAELRRKDGVVYPVQLTTGKLRYGKSDAVMVVAEDRSEYLCAAETVRRTEVELQESQRIALVGRWDYFHHEDRLRWSEIMYEIFEIDPDTPDVSYETILSLIHPDDRQMVDGAWRQSLDDRQPYRIEHRLLMNDGRTKWVRAKCSTDFDEQGRAVRSIAIMHDITATRQAEDRTRFLAEITNNIYESIIATDTDFRIKYVNKNTEKLYGYTEAELLDATPDIFNADSAAAGIQRELYETVSAGKLYKGESLNRRKDGSTFDCEYRVKSFVDKNGKIAGYIGIQRDTTERRRAEEEVRRLAREKETLLKEVQHRIKNNLNTMTSLLFLQANSLQDAAAIQALTDARGRFRSLEILYDQLYRSDSHDSGSVKEYLTQLVNGVLHLFPHPAAVTVHVDIEECASNAKRLSTLGMIVNELVTNAMKYAFRDHSQPRLTVTGCKRDERYAVTISDNGPGLLETPERTASSGFGLTLVDALTRQLDGTIRFERAEGTRVVLEIPL